MALATNTSPGEIQLAGDLAGNNDATAPELTNTAVVAGIYNVPALTIDSKGRVTTASEIPDLSLFTDDATTTSKGIVQIDDVGLDVAVGVLSVNFTEVADNLRDATDLVKGIASFGAGLQVASGNVTSIEASGTTVKGIVKSANANNIVIATGEIDVGPLVAKINVQTVYTAAQSVADVALSIVTANVAVNASLSNIFTLSLTENATLSNPTNLQSGGHYTFVVTNSASFTLGFGINYKFKNNFSSDIQLGAGTISVISCVSNGTDLYCSVSGDFV